jgi:hypothetical protein
MHKGVRVLSERDRDSVGREAVGLQVVRVSSWIDGRGTVMGSAVGYENGNDSEVVEYIISVECSGSAALKKFNCGV